MTNEEFITRARVLHGDKYDYSKVEYRNNQTKIEIICPNHGSFFQNPKSHYLGGYGCKKCSYGSTEKFVEKAKSIHGDRYDYNMSVYDNSLSNISIVCKTHGIFKQKPIHHLRGSGCQMCWKEKAPSVNLSNLDQWVKKAKKVHGERYDYSSVDYKKAKIKIIIKCPEHGEFLQSPHSHLDGSGCPFCQGVIRTTQRFLEKANKTQPNGRFTYEHTHYVNSITPVLVTCVDHGVFSTIPSEHLRGNNGCYRCQGSGPENKWLDSMGIKDRQVRIVLEEGYVIVDGYDERTKTIYEFHGDFWHGNPDVYQPTDINSVRKISYGDLYKSTIDREQRLRDAGYTVLVMWENDWKKTNI